MHAARMHTQTYEADFYWGAQLQASSHSATAAAAADEGCSSSSSSSRHVLEADSLLDLLYVVQEPGVQLSPGSCGNALLR